MPLKQQKATSSKKEGWDTIENSAREVQNLEEPIMLRWPYLWNPPLDHVDFWIYCSSHTPLLTDRLMEIIIEIFLENKRKYTCKAVLVADRFLSIPSLDHAYFWICGAPRCFPHYGRWRPETHSLAGCRSCWTVARPFLG